MKTFCPLYGGDCMKEKCIVWGQFLAVNPQTGKSTGIKAGEGCQWFNKILKSPKGK